MPIRGSSGNQLRLSDIATVTRVYVDPAEVKVRHQGRQVIALGVSMAKGGDIIALGKGLKAVTQRIDRQLPAGLKLVQLQDQPKAVASSVNEFVGVLVEAILIVLVVSFVSLGLHRREGAIRWYRRYYVDMRPGLIVGITIPLVLAVTFLGMYYWGIGLHKISLGSLIISLGLLVDDAIIAVEMMVRKIEEGYDKVRAATFAYEITAMPMLTGTLITATGFLPIGIARSVTGEYTFAIFAVTVLALVVSWVVSVYFVPYLGNGVAEDTAACDRTASPGGCPPGRARMQPPRARSLTARCVASVVAHGRKAPTPHESFDNRFLQPVSSPGELVCLHRWITIGLTLLIFALGIVGMGRVQQQFFPDSSRPEIMLDIWFP